MDTFSRFPMGTSAARAQDPCTGGQPEEVAERLRLLLWKMPDQPRSSARGWEEEVQVLILRCSGPAWPRQTPQPTANSTRPRDPCASGDASVQQ